MYHVLQYHIILLSLLEMEKELIKMTGSSITKQIII